MLSRVNSNPKVESSRLVPSQPVLKDTLSQPMPNIKRTTQNHELVIQLVSPGGKNIVVRRFIPKTEKIGFMHMFRLAGLQGH